MLSRIAFRAVSSSPLAAFSGQLRLPTYVVRCSSSSHTDKPAVTIKATPKPTIEETIVAWDAANSVYYGPQRDLVNFPPVVCRDLSPPTRLGFVPDAWFKFFYEKTGVTGPYALGVGGLTFLLSKEIWIVEHGFSHFVAFWVLFYIMARKYGKSIGEYLDNYSQSLDNRHWYKPMQKTIDEAESSVKEAELVIWREAGQKHLFQAKREHVELQLESIYRQRLNEVHQAVKKRLDYQMEVDSARRHIQQQHMVQWIVDQVVKGITPQQEKDSLSKCIGDLKSLASVKPATA